MKLKNKKTGEIVDLIEGFIIDTRCSEKIMIKPVAINNNVYTSLAELNEEWEDYKEPKEHWYINEFGTLVQITYTRESIYDKSRKNFGNYFETKEEAEKAVEKLKAWKRLKDKGVKIRDYDCYGGTNTKGEFSGEVNITIVVPQEVDNYLFKLLFGGEE